ncbi:TlpA disulfide reductase family protein [Pedobacter sp. R20-19]|uniref:TlpA family protein disulfide reductase n=1 Tax=Pedobacter sp. R20-19 TaxID=1270196 RepID=UPI000493B281|nr:TlpA disulfide reductase family protein [Pedobacter sp. R20-19]
MRIYFATFFLMAGLASAQEKPVKWATQETFFEDLVSKPLSEFHGQTVEGKKFSSKQLENKIIVINFWFEKCPPCIAEMPTLNKLVTQYGAKGIRFIGLTHDAPQSARRFQKRNGYLYEIISLTMDEIRKLNINHGFPSNVLVGRNGKIIYATANISFSDVAFQAKSILFVEKLKAEIKNLPASK